MEIYDTEEEQVAAIKAWWKENGTAAIIGISIGLAAIFGWDYWQDYRKAQAQQASALYDELVKAAKANNTDSTTKIAERMATEFSGTDYVSYSRLMLAKTKAIHNDIPGAKAVLEQLIKNGDKELANLARIRLVRLMLANKEFEQGLKLINEVDPATTESFAGQYDELTGDLYVALNRPDQARTSYQSAQRNGNKSSVLQMKMDDLTTPEKQEATK